MKGQEWLMVGSEALMRWAWYQARSLYEFRARMQGIGLTDEDIERAIDRAKARAAESALSFCDCLDIEYDNVRQELL